MHSALHYSLPFLFNSGRSKVSKVDPDEEQEVDKGLTVEQPYGKPDQNKVEQPCKEADQDEIDQGNEKV